MAYECDRIEGDAGGLWSADVDMWRSSVESGHLPWPVGAKHSCRSSDSLPHVLLNSDLKLAGMSRSGRNAGTAPSSRR